MTKIQHQKGDLFTNLAKSDHNKIVIHCCNDIGKWGKGFVVALSQFDSRPERTFRDSFRRGINCRLGDVQFVPLSTSRPTLHVANIIGQHRVWSENGVPPIRMESLRDGCHKVADFCRANSITEVHAPRIGAGLAGGDWQEISAMLEYVFCGQGLDVHVHTP